MRLWFCKKNLNWLLLVWLLTCWLHVFEHEYEVSLVPMGKELPTAAQMQTSVSTNIRVMYFKNTISTTTIIPFTGVVGTFVINNVPPMDPKAQKLDGNFVPRQLNGPGDQGPDKYDAIFTPDTTTSGSSTIAKEQLIAAHQNGIFFPMGVTATGIPGYLNMNPSNANEFFFFASPPPELGTYKPQMGVGCVMFDHIGQLIPYDPLFIQKREEAAKAPSVKAPVFNYQGATEAFDIFVPMEGSTGKFTIANSPTVIHGHFLPTGKGESATFVPDAAPLLKNLLASSGGKISGAFEQDDSPAVAGIIPNNGMPGTLTLGGEQFTITMTKKYRKGMLTPGKKAIPGFFIFCVGLVQNVVDAHTGATMTLLVEMTETTTTTVTTTTTSEMSEMSYMGASASGARPSGRTTKGRSMVKAKAFDDRTITENMAGWNMLKQDFGAYLRSFSAASGTAKSSKTALSEELPPPPKKLPDGAALGTHYKCDSKSIFLPEISGTNGTFYATKEGTAAKGVFQPPTNDRAFESFWSNDLALASLIPFGHDFILAGKFVPDDEASKESNSKDALGIPGSIRSSKSTPNTYTFKADVPGISGIRLDAAGGRAAIGVALKELKFIPNNPIDVDVHPGWLTQFESMTPNVTLKFDNEIFFGFGNCPHVPHEPGFLATCESDDEILDFYMGILRTNCLYNHKKYMKELIKLGYLEIRHKLIHVPLESKYLILPKLTSEQRDHFSSAFEMSIFTLAYSDAVKGGIVESALTTQDGLRIPRCVKFLVDMTILGIKMSRELFPLHSIRLLRNMITSLGTAIIKLTQDSTAIANCADCIFDKLVIHNSSMKLMGMVQFIVHGLASVQDNVSIRTSYENFCVNHKELIHKKILQFTDERK